MKLRLMALLALLACAFAVDAATTREEVRKSVETSMLVTGTIDIEHDGSVQRYQLDQAEKLPPSVTRLLAKAVPALSFEPVRVDGRIVRARSKMGVRVIAKQLDDGNYSIRIGSASFGQDETSAAERFIAGKRKRLAPPRYPEAAYLSNITGTVYLLVKVNAQGDVDDVAAEQVNLTVLGNERQMERGRKLLSDASITTARKWQFNVPTREDLGTDDYMVVRVPVDFRFHDDRAAKYGEWQSYVPGPRHAPAWITPAEAAQNPDAMIAGEDYPVGGGPKLLTPLPQG